MRARTANTILLGLVVFLGVAALMLLVSGDRGAREAFGDFVLLGLTIALLSFLGYHYRVLPRRQSFQGQARELGLRAQSGDPLGLLDQPFALFRSMASIRDIENTATGVRGGRDLTIADYSFATSRDRSYDEYQRYICMLTSTPSSWSDLSIASETVGSRLRSLLGAPDIRTESVHFDRRFDVRSPDHRFASAFLDARMMEWLLAQASGVGFEILGGRLMLFRPRATKRVDDLHRSVALFDAFWDRVPRVVRTDGSSPGVPPRPDR